MKTSLVRVLSGSFLGALLTLSASAQVVDTTATWNGTDSIAPFGESDTATYGQTFTATAGLNQLNNFTFWLNSGSGPDAVDFAAYVMEWDAILSRATGSILFQSAQQILPFNTPAMTPFVFNTGGLVLDASKQYIAFLSASNFFDGSFGTANAGYLFDDVYANGGFWFSNNGNDFGSLTSNQWENFVGAGVDDLAFRANFSVPVPEPSTYGVIGAAALCGMVALRRLRRKNA
jgi:hypothetical protein